MVESSHAYQHALLVDQDTVVLDFRINQSSRYRSFDSAHRTCRRLNCRQKHFLYFVSKPWSPTNLNVLLLHCFFYNLVCLLLALGKPPSGTKDIFDEEAIVAESNQISDWVCYLARRHALSGVKSYITQVIGIISCSCIVLDQIVHDLETMSCNYQCLLFQVICKFL